MGAKGLSNLHSHIKMSQHIGCHDRERVCMDDDSSLETCASSWVSELDIGSLYLVKG